MKHNAYIGIGSNLETPADQVQQAIHELGNLPHCQLLKASSLYASKPMGPQDQPDYINAVVHLDTDLEPLALLDALQELEHLHRRVRKQHWGPRTLDLDMLLYNEETINHARLQVPHPGLTQRNFVLYPLAEINSQLSLPNGTSLQQLLQDCPLADLVKLAV
ncbi:MAG: 2-amino-4-hydroxy-6-hydroxymethyldihydropteridine diphosphokinase [Oceanospirillaceae bacterium]|nr:2-amino-4-hydroxy-6-hydroxymethyldihydropteridine diphosphokinase [Oceanospirillaceae bacterium]HCI01958.1 2-amino-4-hydroxy-6-hydroxymethyldihydropteridine diphosphokinase [Oceanospirillaceae bacterium]